MRRLGLVVLSIAAVQLLAAAPASAQGSVECGALSGVVNANVIVPDGADCRIQDATINGNVWIKSGGGIIVRGSTINGNVRGSGIEYWGFTDVDNGDRTVINGNVELIETFSNPMAAGATDTMSRYNFACEDTQFNGHVSIRHSLDNADFLFGSPDGGADMMRAPDLNMQVRDCSEMVGQEDQREGNFVRDNYEAVGNLSEVRQRDNVVNGNFNNYGNTAGPMDDIDIVRNDVARFLVCQGNTPVPYQEGNTEAGGGGQNDQCPPS